jgi:hypothetical protein
MKAFLQSNSESFLMCFLTPRVNLGANRDWLRSLSGEAFSEVGWLRHRLDEIPIFTIILLFQRAYILLNNFSKLGSFWVRSLVSAKSETKPDWLAI